MQLSRSSSIEGRILVSLKTKGNLGAYERIQKSIEKTEQSHIQQKPDGSSREHSQILTHPSQTRPTPQMRSTARILFPPQKQSSHPRITYKMPLQSSREPVPLLNPPTLEELKALPSDAVFYIPFTGEILVNHE